MALTPLQSLLIMMSRKPPSLPLVTPPSLLTARLHFIEINVWKRFGLPRKLISDRGPQFTAAFTRDLCSLLNIDQALSTAYHPQSDGQTERVNQELKQYLRTYTSIRQNELGFSPLYRRVRPQHPHPLHDFSVPVLRPHGLSPTVSSP